MRRGLFHAAAKAPTEGRWVLLAGQLCWRVDATLAGESEGPVNTPTWPSAPPRPRPVAAEELVVLEPASSERDAAPILSPLTRPNHPNSRPSPCPCSHPCSRPCCTRAANSTSHLAAGFVQRETLSAIIHYARDI